jgi:hypothetical protein
LLGIITIGLGFATGITYARYKSVIDNKVTETLGNVEYDLDVFLNLTPFRQELSKISILEVNWLDRYFTINDSQGNTRKIMFKTQNDLFPLFSLEQDQNWIEQNSPNTFGRYGLHNEYKFNGINNENGEVFLELYFDRKNKKFVENNLYK